MFAADEQTEQFKNSKQKGSVLRIDHSKVHFANERLSENLHFDINELASNKHKQWMSRTSEIKEIKETLQNYNTIQGESSLKKRKNLPPRPYTSSAYICKRGKIGQAGNLTKLGPNIRIPQIDDDANSLSEDSDDSSFIDDDPFSKKRVKSAPAPTASQEGHSNNTNGAHDEEKPQISQSGPRKAFTKRSSPSPAFFIQTKSKTFKAPDSSEKRPRSTLVPGYSARRGQSAKTVSSVTITTPSYQDKRGQTAKTSTYSSSENLLVDPKPRGRRLNVMCERTSNILSRRQLIAMTNVDRLIDERKSANPREILLEVNRLYAQKLDQRVRLFVESLEKLKKKEAEKELLRTLRIKETFE
ncbi:uncharacterized protein LOC126810337 [Patella vulgata]|uniref:uncharacterized protein LOC126810337 n=1 Tax=Patella vulgata TaxID=6465 RepID=UPI0021804B3B|nr:uncharacterized protein LOC126810337 [Patella vulgata]